MAKLKLRSKLNLIKTLFFFWNFFIISVAGNRIRVSRVKAEYPYQLDYNGIDKIIVISLKRNDIIKTSQDWFWCGDHLLGETVWVLVKPKQILEKPSFMMSSDLSNLAAGWMIPFDLLIIIQKNRFQELLITRKMFFIVLW